MAEQWPTEEAATEAVAAAAKAWLESRGDGWPAWDDLHHMERHRIKEAVLPIVWAALAALPDPRYPAWQEGRESIAKDFLQPLREDGTREASTNPYPSPLG